MKKSSWFIFFLILAVSCLDDPDCFRLNNNVVGFAFKVIGSSRPDTVRLAKVNVSGTQNFVPDTITSSVYVPINFTTTSSQITFSFDDGTSKFLDLDYLLKTQFISEDCGSRYELSNLSVRDSDIDSIRVISSAPGKSTGAINIEIMRCPNPRYVGVAFFDLTPSSSALFGYTVKAGSLGVDSITNTNGDVFYRQSSRPIFYLPIDPATTGTTFNFYTRGGDPQAPQQLQLSYTTRQQNAFPDLCPDVQSVNNLRIVAADDALAPIDSLGINDNNDFLDYITDPPSSNVRLFRCPQTNLARLTFRRKTSAAGTQSEPDTFAIKRITADYAPGRVYAANRDLVNVTLPVNPNGDATTFYIEYTKSSIPNDTVRVTYTRTDTQTGIRGCGTMTTYTNLAAGAGNASNIIVAPSGNAESSILHNPPTITNIQVTHEIDQ
jgi:hypothetical protein